MYFVSQETAIKLEFDKLIERYRERRLFAQKERREYYCDHGHNWIINMCKDIEKDLKELKELTTQKTSDTKEPVIMTGCPDEMEDVYDS